jgi:UDP-N-acetylmuramoylalanine--D-glutamate ligase
MIVMARKHDMPHASAGLRLVVGLGATGRSCLTWLDRRGCRLRVVDSRDLPPERAVIDTLNRRPETRFGGLDLSALEGVSEVVVSPGVPLEEPLITAARRAGIPVVGDIELFARAVSRPVAAITGSNGKSTVTTLVARMAEAAGRSTLAGGNLGTPALDLLAEPAPDLYVLELSSFQLELTASLRAKAAVVLNLSADHIDRHGSLERYAAAKARIYDHAETAIANRDDPAAARLAPAGGNTVTFGLDAPPSDRDFGVVTDDVGAAWLCRGQERLVAAAGIALRGGHNLANVLAAMAMGEALGLATSPMVAAAGEFAGLPHRMRRVHSAGGVDWIDDSKATNVGAAAAALAGTARPIVLVAGGDAKGANLDALAEAARGRVKAAVLLGQDADRLEAVLGGVAPVVTVTTLEQAVEAAAGLAMPGDVVLLSPACASTDMFRDYRERGDCFARLAREVAP